MAKHINEVVLVGFFKPRIIPREDGSFFVTGRLCSTDRDENNTNTETENWHTIVPMTKKAAESIRTWDPPVPVAFIQGRFFRRQYTQDGKLKYANEIQIFEPISAPAGFNRRNEIEISGNLGAKPSVRYSLDGDPDITLSVATNHYRRDNRAPDGWAKTTVWHTAVLFGENGLETVAGLSKGDYVLIKGALSYRPRKRSDDGTVAELLVHSLDRPTSKTQTKPHQHVEDLGRPFDASTKNPQHNLFPGPSAPVSAAHNPPL